MSKVVRSGVGRASLALGLVLHACAAAREGGETTGPVGENAGTLAAAKPPVKVSLGSVGVSDDDAQPPPPQQELAFAAQQVFDALSSRHGQAVSCYRTAIQSHGVSEGAAKFVLSIDPKGTVTRATPGEGAPLTGELAACARDLFAGLTVQNVPAEGLEASLDLAFAYASNATLWTLDPIRIGRHGSSTPAASTNTPANTPTNAPAGRRRRPRGRKPEAFKLVAPSVAGVAQMIRTGLLSQQSALDACANALAPQQSASLPSLTVGFVIDPNSKVTWARLESSDANGEGAWSCVERAVRAASFPRLGATAQRARVTFTVVQ